MAPAVAADTVRFQCKDQPCRALDGIDLTLAEGEFAAVMGPSFGLLRAEIASRVGEALITVRLAGQEACRGAEGQF